MEDPSVHGPQVCPGDRWSLFHGLDWIIIHTGPNLVLGFIIPLGFRLTDSETSGVQSWSYRLVQLKDRGSCGGSEWVQVFAVVSVVR